MSVKLFSEKLTFKPIDKCARKVYNKCVLRKEQRKGINVMQLLKLGQEDYDALENVKELLDTLMKQMKSDSNHQMMNYDTQRFLDYDALKLAQRYLKRNFG